MLLNNFWPTAHTGSHGSVSSTGQAKMQNITLFAAFVERPTVGVFGLD